jgi:ornithine cyclodeaminase/alanine dehydrogenase-like protein (mu-crystallin family)
MRVTSHSEAVHLARCAGQDAANRRMRTEIVAKVEYQIAGQRRGQVWCAPKAAVWPGDDRFIMVTLGIATEPNIVATKALALNPRNGKRNLPTLNSLITLLDGETGYR